MITSLGKITDKDEIILDKAIFHIEETQGSSQGLGQWSGFFTYPSDANEGFVKIYHAREPLTLALEDGRTGQFIVTKVAGMGAGATVTIQGTGGLKKCD